MFLLPLIGLSVECCLYFSTVPLASPQQNMQKYCEIGRKNHASFARLLSATQPGDRRRLVLYPRIGHFTRREHV